MPLSPRQKAFFLIALYQRPKSVEPLFEQLPESECAEMKQMYSELRSNREADIKQVAKSELRKLNSVKVSTYLNEVHEDWLVDLLKQESPLMIATVLRYLPAERVHTILDLLPEPILTSLPKISDTFAISQSLVSLLKARFESLFTLKKTYEPGQPLAFEHLALLRAKQVENIFFEAGYREISLGLIAVPDQARNLVLGRLAAADRDRVEFHLQNAQQVSEQRIKRAQVHLISKQVDPHNQRLFVKELGVMLFVKALLKKDLEDVDLIYKKMPKIEAKMIRDLVVQYVEKNTEASVKTYREDILDAIKRVLSPQS